MQGRVSRWKEAVQRFKLEIAQIRSLSVENLHMLWQQKFERRIPAALSKDLMSRMLCFKVQEDSFGGFDRATLKRLDAYADGTKGGVKQAGHLRAGTELTREYQGERLKVIVTEDGFVFKGKNYSSLTSIARSVTGTNWNGPKFFRLRAKDEKAAPPLIPLSEEASKLSQPRGLPYEPLQETLSLYHLHAETGRISARNVA